MRLGRGASIVSLAANPFCLKQVVTGATGRVGSLAVRRLLELYPNVLVRAVVNDLAKGSRLLKDEKDKYGIKLEVSQRTRRAA